MVTGNIGNISVTLTNVTGNIGNIGTHSFRSVTSTDTVTKIVTEEKILNSARFRAGGAGNVKNRFSRNQSLSIFVQ